VILVTGGAGFIGANFVLAWLQSCDEPIVNLDKLTYAGNLQNLADAETAGDRHQFMHGDIADYDQVLALLLKHKIRAVVNFAAYHHTYGLPVVTTNCSSPANSRMSNRKFAETFDLRLPPWQDGVRHVLEQIF
jgi:dTDP-D-glucose 4,6-dehydratase